MSLILSHHQRMPVLPRNRKNEKKQPQCECCDEFQRAEAGALPQRIWERHSLMATGKWEGSKRYAVTMMKALWYTFDPWTMWRLGTLIPHADENPHMSFDSDTLNHSWLFVSVDSTNCRTKGVFLICGWETKDVDSCTNSLLLIRRLTDTYSWLMHFCMLYVLYTVLLQ